MHQKKLKPFPQKLKNQSNHRGKHDAKQHRTRINWVIVGGERGAGVRPIEKSWVLGIRDLCAKKKIPFFFKQWGGVRKKEAGRLLDGRTYDEMPPIPVKRRVMDESERLSWIKEISELQVLT